MFTAISMKRFCIVFQYVVLQDVIACVLLIMIFSRPCSSSSNLWFALKKSLVCAVNTYETEGAYDY
jgi:hypothetical protein